jgi:hypothetical protein
MPLGCSILFRAGAAAARWIKAMPESAWHLQQGPEGKSFLLKSYSQRHTRLHANSTMDYLANIA